MLDLGFVRGNLEKVEEKLRARGADPAALLGDFRVLDQRRREAITQAEQVKALRNDLSQQVGARKKAGQDAAALMEETRALKVRLDELDSTAATLDEQMRLALARIPNLTRDEVPAGSSEADNVTVKTWGEKPKFDFEPKPHWELGEALGILDLERAAKLSGARFAVYMGAGAQLERALIGFMGSSADRAQGQAAHQMALHQHAEDQRRDERGGGQRAGLAEQVGHGLGIVVPLQDFVDHRSEAHEAAPGGLVLDLERGDEVVGMVGEFGHGEVPLTSSGRDGEAARTKAGSAY